MLIYPWFYGSFQWSYVHSVWLTWQSLNVGIIAFASSLIAFNISKFNAERQRERDFIAERALLPQALSDLCSYINKTVPGIIEAGSRAKLPNHERKKPLNADLALKPTSPIEVFQSCIRVAEPSIGEYLALILNELQVHSSRIESMHHSFDQKSKAFHGHRDTISYLYSAGLLRARLNILFDFARGNSSFNTNRLTIHEVKMAYQLLDIYPEMIDGLWDFTDVVFPKSG